MEHFSQLAFSISAATRQPRANEQNGVDYHFMSEGKFQENIKNKAQLVFKPKFDGLDAFLNYQEKIEQRQDLKTLPSLLFTHKTGFTLQSKVFLNSSGEILKALQERIDTNGVKVSTTFYFLKEVLSMVQVDQENLRLSRLEHHQTRDPWRK